jgi:predicted protein tyrosine phosphatase
VVPCITVVVVCAAFWTPLFETNLHEVVPGEIYRSGQPDAERLAEMIDELGLRSVVTLRGEDVEAAWYRDELALTGDLGLEFRAVRLSGDRMPRRKRLVQVVDWIDALPRPILLHCQGGVERVGLASAVAMLLDGRPLSVAEDQFALRYGYHPWHAQSNLPLVLADYRDWLGGRESDAERFRAFAREHYVADVYSADLELLVPLADARIGETPLVSVRATNTSPRPWSVATDPLGGVHLLVRARTTGEGRREYPDLRTTGTNAVVLPGESIEFSARLHPFDVPGRHRVEVDLAKRPGYHFRWMGSKSLVAWIDVTPSASPPPLAAPLQVGAR